MSIITESLLVWYLAIMIYIMKLGEQGNTTTPINHRGAVCVCDRAFKDRCANLLQKRSR